MSNTSLGLLFMLYSSNHATHVNSLEGKKLPKTLWFKYFSAAASHPIRFSCLGSSSKSDQVFCVVPYTIGIVKNTPMFEFYAMIFHLKKKPNHFSWSTVTIILYSNLNSSLCEQHCQPNLYVSLLHGYSANCLLAIAK